MSYAGTICVRHFLRFLRAARHERGQSLVELALILPVAFLMTFGFINFALVIFGMGNANFASRAAERYITLHSSTSYHAATQADLNAIVGSYMFSYPSKTWTVTPYYYTGNVVGSGCDITVTVTYHFKVMNYTYSGISYSSTGWGSIQQ